MTIASDPIVLFGAPRSGTTFLTELLNAHPEVHITHEMRLFAWAHETLVKSAKINRLLVTHREEFLEHATKYSAGMIRDFYAAQWPHVRYWGDKNPHYADVWNRGCLDTIRKIFPGAKFIHIIRDGRDVVASIGAAFGRKISPGSYHEIRYEDLVADEHLAARSLFGFLDIPLHPAVEDFCLQQRVERSNFSSPTRDLSAGDAGRSEWSQALSAEQQATVMHILAPKLAELGYATSPEPHA